MKDTIPFPKTSPETCTLCECRELIQMLDEEESCTST